jgi:hypothetical protein
MDPDFHKVARTVAFSENTAAAHTVFTPDADKRFVVTKWYLMAAVAVTAKFVSNATDISGALPLQANIAYSDGSGDEAVLVGLANGDPLKVTLGGAQQVDGYFVIGQLQE